MAVSARNAQESDATHVALPGWEEQYTQMSSGRLSRSLVHAEIGAVQLYEESINLRVEQEFLSPADAMVFSFDMNENVLYLLDGQTHNAWVTPEHYREVAVVFKRNAVWANSTTGFEELALQPLQSRHCAAFATSLSGFLADLVEGNTRIENPGFAQHVIESCFNFLGETFQVESRSRSEHQARRVVERVKEVIRDCPQENLGSLELADRAGVSVRHLQQSFLRYAGVPPTVWLRNRRLNGARLDLLAASRGELTVAEVAMRWSFWHLGRFSQSYHALFGEHPNVTRKRGLDRNSTSFPGI